MELHIGNEIEKVLEKKGITPEWLANQINTSRRNLYDMLTRKELSVSHLMAVSKALDFDFFSLYQSGLAEEPQIEKFSKERAKVTMTVELDGLQTTLNHWFELMKRVNAAI